MPDQRPPMKAHNLPWASSLRAGALASLAFLVLSVMTIPPRFSLAQEIVANGPDREVIVALLKHFPPQYQLDSDGAPTGFAVDVMDAIAARTGLRLKYVVTGSGAETIDELLSGRADIMPNVGIAAGREETMGFTAPLETFRVSLFVRDDTFGITSLDDLAGKEVGVIEANLGQRIVADRSDARVTVYADYPEALFALLAGTIDAFIYPEAVIWQAARDARVDTKIKTAGPPLREVKRAIAVRKDNTALLALLAPAVDEFLETQEYRQIYMRWYGGPAPFWSATRVAIIFGALLITSILGLLFWRQLSLHRLNVQLRESEQALRLFQNSTTEGFTLFDRELRLLNANAAALAYLKVPKAQAIGKPLLELMPYLAGTERYDNYQRVAKAGGRYDSDVEMIGNDGKTSYRAVSAFRAGDGLGIITRDIADRKRAETALEESESRLNAFFAEAPAGLVILDHDLRYVKVNETTARDHNLSPEDHVGRSIHDVSPKIGQIMGPLFRQVFETGEPIENFEYEDEELGWFGVKSTSVTSFFPILGTDGTPHAVGAISTDITDKKWAEAALRQSEETLSLFQDSATEGFSLFDSDLRLLNANAAALRYVKVPKEEAIGKPILELMPDLAGTNRYARYEEIAKAGGRYDSEIAITEDDGMTRHRAVSAFRAGNGVGIITRDISGWKKAEVALRKSEELRTLFMDSAGAAFVLFDSELNFLDINKAGLDRFKLVKEEVIGRNLAELSPDLVKSGRLDRYLDVIRTGEPIRLEVPSRDHRAGQQTIMDMRVFPVADGLGVISEDITEKKNAEAALHKTEERWNLFTEVATQAFMLFDADFNLIDINEGGARQFKFGTRQNLIGKNMLEISPGALSSGRLERYREVLRTGNPLRLTGVPLGDTGIIQEIRAFRVGVGLGVMAEDITERKRTEGALRESEERRRLFMDSAGEAFVLFDSDLNFIDINRAGLDQFDFAREEIIGKNLAALSPDAVSSGRYDRYFELLKTGKSHRSEVTHVVKDGHERIMDLRTFPVGDGMGVISEDITVRKHAERQLESLNHRLEELVTERTAELRATQDELLSAERLAALGQLTATVAHELRNPLGTIRTSVFNLRSKWRGNSDGIGRPLQRIERNIARCDRIISELLDFSANQEPILETVDLNQCIAAWIDDYEASEGSAIHLAISDSNAKMRVDQDRLHQVIVNLLDNASQAREASPGTLRRDIKIAVRTQVDGHNFILEVADDGPGIPSDILPRIFEPLFSTKGFGVGLGLPLVKKIIDQHGGDIKVVTAVGDGTTFRISLPLAESKEAAA